MKATAAILYNINQPLEIEEIDIPELKFGQVLVRIVYSGICHSQLNEIKGLKGEDRFLPHTLGHEGVGIVEEVGPDVQKVKSGDKVVLTWIKGSGADATYSSYKRKDGTIVNSGAISTFMTKAIISENRLVKIPNEMSLREAVLLGCAIPTGAGIIINTVKFSKGNTVAIFGMGGIGLSVLLAVKLKKASLVIAVDVFDNKLNTAAELGATYMINAEKQDVLSEILKITDNQGVDCSIECAGKKESMETAFKSVKDKGGICVVAGNLPKGETISIDPFDLIKGKRVVGTWGGETNPDRDIALYIDWFMKGKLELSKLITHEYRLREINEAFKELSREYAGRILINMVEE